MKKRLLSAALALAMVLTMLPLSVFADDSTATADGKFTSGGSDPTPGEGHAISQATSDIYATVDGEKVWKVEKGQWYTSKSVTEDGKSVTKYYVADSGVVAGGKWYSTGDKALEDGKATSVKVIEGSTNVAFDLSKATGGSLSIELNGTGVGFGTSALKQNQTDTSANTKLTSLTITNTAKNTDGTAKKAAVTGSITATSQQFSYTASNTSGEGPSITLTNETTSAKTLTVNLTDATTGALAVTKGALSLTVNASTKGAAGTGAITVNETAPDNNLAFDCGTTSINVKGGTTKGITINGKGTITLQDMATTEGITLFGGTKDAKTNALPKWGGNLTVNVGSQCVTGAITEGENNNGVITINANAGSGSTKGITSIDLTKSTTAHIVSVNGGTVTGELKMKAGTLTISNGAKVGGALTLGGDGGGKITATISGTDTNVGAITASPLTADSAVNISGGTITSVTLPEDYNKHTISGGTFGSAITKEGWLKDVTYQIKKSVSGKDSYTYTKSFQDCVDAYKADSSNEISVIGTGNTSYKATFKLDDSDTAVVEISGDANHGIVLPGTVNGKTVSVWYMDDNTPKAAGALIELSKAVTFKATTGASDNSNITAVCVSGKDDNGGLSATLSGDTIKVSGALKADASGFVAIKLKITTASGKEYDEVPVSYSVTGKKLIPGASLPDPFTAGMDNASIQIKGTSLTYPLDGSGLIVSAGGMKATEYGSAKAVSTVSISSLGTSEKAALKIVLDKVTASFEESPAAKEAVNKVIAGLSQSQVDQYVYQAKVALWKKATGLTRNPTESELNASSAKSYDKLQVVLYLNIQATGWNKSAGAPSLSLNITPYYRLDVVDSASSSAGEPYTVKAGTALSLTNTTSELGSVTVTLGNDFGTSVGTLEWAHHGSYVYQIKDSKFTTTHGFSPFVLNMVEPVAKLTDEDKTSPKAEYYDNVQIAIDNAEEGDTVTLNPNYGKTSETYTVTGKARSFTFNPGLNGSFVPTFNGANVTTDKTNGNIWKVQLNADTAVNTASITVKTGTNGSAKASAASAKPGDTVTITTTANSGYKAAAPTVVASTGNVTVTGSGNTWTFTVPANATSVTVTPNFVADDGRIFSDVDPKAWYADAVHNCYNTKPRGVSLMQGNTNGTFTPLNQLTRAEMVQILYNLAGQPSVSGTCPFPDVVGTGYHWAAPAITWAASKGYVIGYTDGKFHPEVNVSRQDMVLILYRYSGANSSLATGNLNNYYDGTGVGWWANEAMRWATAMGILSGTDSVALNGYLRAPQKAARCEAAVTLWNYYQRYGA